MGRSTPPTRIMNQLNIIIALLLCILGILYTIYGRMCVDRLGSDKWAGPIIGLLLSWIGWGILGFSVAVYVTGK